MKHRPTLSDDYHKGINKVTGSVSYYILTQSHAASSQNAGLPYDGLQTSRYGNAAWYDKTACDRVVCDDSTSPVKQLLMNHPKTPIGMLNYIEGLCPGVRPMGCLAGSFR